MLQFSLRNLLIAVAFFAFAAAALVNANSWWVAIAWSTTLFSLAAAVLLSVYRRDEKRAFWSGFAVLGTLYVLLLMYSIQPVSSSNSSVLCLQPLSYVNLLTTKLSYWSYSRLPVALTTEYLPGSRPAVPADSMPGMRGPIIGKAWRFGDIPNPRFVDHQAYLEVAQALWTLLLASLGGALARRIQKPRSPRAELVGTGAGRA